MRAERPGGPPSSCHPDRRDDGRLTIANGTIVPLGPDRDIEISAGPGGATHFVVDVAGYWR